MICSKCGKELREGTKFCPGCGAPVQAKNVAAASAEAPSVPNNEKKKSYKGLVAIIIVLIVLVIGAACAAFWFLGGRDWLYDIIGNDGSTEAIDDDDDAYIDSAEEMDDDTDDNGLLRKIFSGNMQKEETESSESDMEATEPETAEDDNATTEAAPDTGLDDVAAEEEEDEEEEEIEEPSEYILENSDSEYLTKDDLVGMTAEECRLARNELYARHGRMFDDEELRSYFESCSWYQGTIEAADFQESMLSDIEIANRDLIVEYEKEMGYR